MSVSISNVLSAGSDFAVNSYVSPVYSAIPNEVRAPGQPAPAFFAIWTPIFAGRIAYGFLSDEERSTASTLWNHAIAAAGFTYAWSLVDRRFYTMEASMLAMTYAFYKYRKALPESDTLESKSVRFAAEMGLGWLAAADALIDIKNVRRAIRRQFTHAEEDVIGAVEVAVAAGAGVAANHLLGWKGVGAAAAWALTGIALDRKSEKHVRKMAGVAAVGLIADLAFSVWSDRKAQLAEAADQATNSKIDGFVEIDVIPTVDGYILEETVTTVQH